MLAPLSQATQGTGAAPQTAPAAGSAASAGAGTASKTDGAMLARAVAAANQSATKLGSAVRFNVDPQSGRAIVRVVDSETGQLIRQIPSEEMLELRRALDRIAGLVIEETA